MSFVNTQKTLGERLAELEAERFSLWKIKEAVHEFPKLLAKQEKLEKRLVQVSGRDFDQEEVVMLRLEEVENLIDIINYAIYGDEILTPRESVMVEHRLDGETLEEIGELIGITRQGVSCNLSKAYKKISDAAKARYLG